MKINWKSAGYELLVLLAVATLLALVNAPFWTALVAGFAIGWVWQSKWPVIKR